MLSWRVPTSGDPRLLRLALAQVGLASIVAGLLLLVAIPREWLGPALFGLIPLAIFMAYRRWSAYQRSMDGVDNVRLDTTGLYWMDAAGVEQAFRRDGVISFHIGRDADTLRPVPALTLHLLGGFESQPIELHLPATCEAVRGVLTEEWRIAERDRPSGEGTDYDAAVSVYGECHEEFQEWHLEGTRGELSRFFELMAAAAEELPLPPRGAKPLSRTILLTRREPMRLRLAHDRVVVMEPNMIAAPADVLRTIAASGAAAVEGGSEKGDLKFDVLAGPNSVWTFHLHVRPA